VGDFWQTDFTGTRKVSHEVENTATMDSIVTALGLLEAGNACRIGGVRKYAVLRLKQASDSDLELYLLQLVQALRFEGFDRIKEGLHLQLVEFYEQGVEATEEMHLQDFDQDGAELKSLASGAPLCCRQNEGKAADDCDGCDGAGSRTPLERASSCPGAMHGASWRFDNRYLHPAAGASTRRKGSSISDIRFVPAASPASDNVIPTWTDYSNRTWDLCSFLIDRCSKNFRLANYFYWYLMTESESPGNGIAVQEMYLIVLKRFLMKLDHADAAASPLKSPSTASIMLHRQYTFVSALTSVMAEIKRESKLSRPRKLRLLKEILVVPRKDFEGSSFADFRGIPLPLDPDAIVDGILPAKTEIFKSAMLPCKLEFRLSGANYKRALASSCCFTNAGTAEERGTYRVIFKVGNDLRQDQLAVQMISLFNRIFLEVGLDFCVTPYRVLATSPNSGFVEYIESRSVASVVSEYGGILKYLDSLATRRKGTRSVVADFTKSCAAYCVMTYVLGVGDRHLDNLLITKTGRIFHVDFAYLFGQDPKPVSPPPMRLTRHMVQAMGGANSAGFQQFRQYCHSAYTALRRNSGLILSLFSLMSESGLPCCQPSANTTVTSSSSSRSSSRSSSPTASLLPRSPSSPHLHQSPSVDAVKRRLRPELSESEAAAHLDAMIRLSASAVVASFVERLHAFAQAFRT